MPLSWKQPVRDPSFGRQAGTCRGYGATDLEAIMLKKITAQGLMIAVVLLLIGSDLFAQTRIRFRKGSSSATVSGKIAAEGKRTYVLSAKAGQTLLASLESGNSCVNFGYFFFQKDFTTVSGDNSITFYNSCKGKTRATTFTLTVSIR
jgi:hypothetical protein